MRVVINDRGDLAGLADQWGEDEAAVVVDACSSGGGAGAIHRFDATASPLPARMSGTSSHAFGVADAVELARAIDRMPRSLIVYAIEGSCFELGVGLTPEVERAVARLVEGLRSGGVSDSAP
jgi:hydrogenase maturation protease